MANPANETSMYPFSAFNFAVEINVPGIAPKVCNASFSECDGLDMTMEVKTIREGGNNGSQIRLVGAMSFGQLTLKRGMTASFDLWDWFDAIYQADSQKLRSDLRTDAEVVVIAPDHSTERVRFILKRCLPVKLKAPALNAKDGMVAIEELQLAYESLKVKKPGAGSGGSGGAGGGTGVGVSAGIGFSVGGL
jgi:phage tail-like protein